MTEEHEQLRKCVADAWDWSAAQLKDGVPPLDVALALLAVAITMGKSLLGEAPTKFTQIAMDVVRKLEGARVETLVQLRPPTARRRR
jgi:hypothetical protein